MFFGRLLGRLLVRMLSRFISRLLGRLLGRLLERLLGRLRGGLLDKLKLASFIDKEKVFNFTPDCSMLGQSRS
jgi:hypothetical protein